MAETTQARGWVIGRAAGIPVVLSPGWLVAAVVLTVITLPTARALAPDTGDAGALLLALATVLMLFGSTFLHELAHAAVARRHGMVVRQIVLTLLGGHTEFADSAPGPGASALVAVAGPATNIALGLVAFVAWRTSPATGAAAALLLAAALTNGFVGVFNLLPGLPLDGGRILESAVWAATGRRSSGTVAAALAGHLIALIVVAGVLLPPFLAGHPPSLTQVVWGAIIAGVLWSGATQSRQAARTDRAVDALSVRALSRPAVAMSMDAPVAATDGFGEPAPDIVLIAADGSPVAYVDQTARAAVPAERRKAVSLVAVGVPLPPGAVIDADLTGRAALVAVADIARATPVIVVTSNARVVGILRATDVARAMRPGT